MSDGIHFTGNLTRDPELRFSPSGAAWVKFRLAHTPRSKNAEGEWVDGETKFVSCKAFRDLAEHIAESLSKGDRVLVVGKLKEERWTGSQDGKERIDQVLMVDDAGPSLFRANAKVNKAVRSNQTQADAWTTDPGF